MQDQQTAAGRYQVLSGNRTTYLDRARQAAKLTIPSLFPPEGSNGNTVLPTPYQGMGARGVNNLASKLLLTLFPPNSPFFRLMVDDFTVRQMQTVRAELETGLGMIERTVQTDIETGMIRVDMFEALKYLITSGNVLIQKIGKGVRVFRLDRYVVQRGPMGEVLEIITKEDLSMAELSPELRAAATVEATNNSPDATIALYTRIIREKDKWSTYQEIAGKLVPGSEGTFPLDRLPYIALRFTKMDGEDYGRGYVEEYLGELVSLEALTQAIVEGSAAAAKILFLVSPNGTTNQKTLAEAPNGAIRAGNAADVTVIQAQKYADFNIAFQTIQRIEQRLSFAFLLNTAIQRPGERVTAEEIRYMAGELEDALGGVYSILSQELQLPLVTLVMADLEKSGRLPKLPKDVVTPTITTGLEALGRGHDLNKLNVLFSTIAPLGPEVLSQYMNIGDYIERIATSLGIDTAGLIKTPEEIQAEQQAAQQAAMMQQAMSSMGPGVMDMAKEQMSNG